MKTQIFTLKTERQGYYDITRTVREAVRESGIQSGIAVVFCPHTTGAMKLGLDAAFPDRAAFRHAEGNSDAHLKCSTVGASETILIEDGKLLLGIWQGVYFCEFDGPRTRKYFVKIMEDRG